jgi:hypothetical protein
VKEKREWETGATEIKARLINGNRKNGHAEKGIKEKSADLENSNGNVK